MRLIARLSGLLLIAFALNTYAAAPSVEQVQKFIDVSGLGSSIESMPDQFRQQMQLQQLLEEDKLSMEVVQSAIEQALNDVNGYAIAESYLLQSSDAAKIETTIAFLESDTGRRIVAAEKAAQSPNYQAELQAYATQLAQNQPSPERQQLVNEFMAVTNAVEVVVNTIKVMMYAAVDFFEAYEPEKEAQAKSAIDAEWQKIAPIMKEQMRQYVLLSSYYTYRELSDSEFKAYNEFLASDAGKAYFEVSMGIYEKYVSDIMRGMAANIIAQSEQS
ncbi:MAG: hypothetical protein R3183_11855 [Oleiphilaceae bacterium]|nr:hypothetical protein [Oleiphilaceae bacterium]